MNNTILIGDVLEKLKEIPDKTVNTCVTSPPYWGLRDYGAEGQIGLEKTPEEYVNKMVQVFREVRRVLRDDGTLWLNLGDSYAASRSYQVIDNKHKDVGNKIGHSVPEGLKPKDLVGIPWMVAFALRADGWYLRQDIIWHKPNPMPESVKDRCTKAHEYIFLLSKSGKTTLWRHSETLKFVYNKPEPDYIWKHKDTGDISRVEILDKKWKRRNLWRSCDYYFDDEAIKEPAAYLQANSPESIKSPYAQNVKKYKGNANTFRGGAYCNGDKDNSELGKRTTTGNTNPHKGAVTPGQSPCGKALKRMNGENDPDYITRNKRSVWTVSTAPFPGSHFATFPPDLIEPCILAGSPRGGIVLDPFFGAGTTGIVSLKNGRDYIGIELNPEYAEMAENRIKYGTVNPEEIEAEKKQGVLF